MTDHKAWAGALASLLAIVATRALSDWLGLTLAEATALGPILDTLAQALVGAAIGYAVVWMGPANRVKGAP